MARSLRLTGLHRHASWLKCSAGLRETRCREPSRANQLETTHALAPHARGRAAADAGEDIEANRRPALRRSWDGEASPGVNRRRAKLLFRVPANTMAAP
jgi:hypothetical protein